MMYSLKNSSFTKRYKFICIREYLSSKTNKWTKLKKTIGTYSDPITDEMLNDFISKEKPVEVNIECIDKKNESHFVDFDIKDFEK